MKQEKQGVRHTQLDGQGGDCCWRSARPGKRYLQRIILYPLSARYHVMHGQDHAV